MSRQLALKWPGHLQTSFNPASTPVGDVRFQRAAAPIGIDRDVFLQLPHVVPAVVAAAAVRPHDGDQNVAFFRQGEVLCRRRCPQDRAAVRDRNVGVHPATVQRVVYSMTFVQCQVKVVTYLYVIDQLKTPL
jgi:hypothetical protein